MVEFQIESIALDAGDATRLYLFGEDKELVLLFDVDEETPDDAEITLDGKPWPDDAPILRLVGTLHAGGYRVRTPVHKARTLETWTAHFTGPIAAAATPAESVPQRTVAPPKPRTTLRKGSRVTPPPAHNEVRNVKPDGERRIKIERPGTGVPKFRNKCVAVNAGPFANPFTIDSLANPGKVDNANRSELVMLFQRWIRGDARLKLEANLKPEFVDRWPELDARRRTLLDELRRRLYPTLDAGGRVGCHCEPTESCHGDVLVALWRERWKEGSPLE